MRTTRAATDIMRTTAGTATDADGRTNGDLYSTQGGNGLAASRTVHDK